MAFRIVRDDISKIGAAMVAETAGTGNEAGGIWDERRVRQWYDETLRRAAKEGAESVAFPLITGAACGENPEMIAQIAAESFGSFLQKQEIEIYLVVPDDYRERISGELFLNVNSYMAGRFGAAESFEGSVARDVVTGLLKEPKPTGSSESQASAPKQSSVMPQPSISPQALVPPQPSRSKPRLRLRKPALKAKPGVRDVSLPLEEQLKQMYTDSFAKHLQQLINKKGMNNSEVYAAANISKQYFSKLMKGQVKPSKEKVLALAVGLRLNIDETVDFLRIAGYALSPVSQTDVIVEYFIRNEDYSVVKIDIVLFDYGLPPLSDSRSSA